MQYRFFSSPQFASQVPTFQTQTLLHLILLRLYQKLYQELQQEHEAALGAGKGGQTRGTSEKVEGDAQCRRGGAGRAEEVEVVETEGRIKRDDSTSSPSSRNGTATSSAIPAGAECEAEAPAAETTARRNRKYRASTDQDEADADHSHHKGNAKSPARRSSASSTSTSSTPDERNGSPAARHGPPILSKNVPTPESRSGFCNTNLELLGVTHHKLQSVV